MRYFYNKILIRKKMTQFSQLPNTLIPQTRTNSTRKIEIRKMNQQNNIKFDGHTCHFIGGTHA